MAGHIISRKIVDWVIVGGESGHGARPMHPEWVRSLRNQCNDAGVSFFFKQWGELSPESPNPGHVEWSTLAKYDARSHIDRLKADGMKFIRDAPMWRTGKKVAGRLLDGREWNEFPATFEVSR